MKIIVQKFGGTSVDQPKNRALACAKVIKAVENGLSPVVVVSAIGRKGAPYATDTLVNVLKEIDPQVLPAPRELDMMMACGEIISTDHHRSGFRQRPHSGDPTAVPASPAGAGLYSRRLRFSGHHRAGPRT
jgi:aspartokinase